MYISKKILCLKMLPNFEEINTTYSNECQNKRIKLNKQTRKDTC